MIAPMRFRLADLPPRIRPLWVIATLLFALACLFASQCLPGAQEVVNLGSPWQGDFTRATDGLHVAGEQKVKVIAAPIHLVPHTTYEVRLTATASIPFHVDFIGPGYDNAAQESVIEPIGFDRSSRRLRFDSGDSPELASVRVFYEGASEVTLHRLSIVRSAAAVQWVSWTLLFLSILSVGVLCRDLLPAEGFHALCLASLAFAVYLALSGHIPAADDSDNVWYLPTAESLLHDGDLDLAEQSAKIERLKAHGSGYSVIEHPSEGVISILPLGTSLLAVPFVAVARQFHASDAQMAGVLAALLASGAVGVLFLCLRALSLTPWLAAAVALVFAFASSQFSIHAGGLWSHNTALLVALIYLHLLLHPEPVSVGCAAPLGIFGYICRPDFSLLIIAGFIYLCFERRALAGWFLGLSLLAAAPFVLWSLSAFGSPVPLYYRSSRVHVSMQTPIVLLGQLFSPNRGLLIFNPFVLLGIIGGIMSFTMHIPNRRFFQALFVVFSLHAVVISSFQHWWGGSSFGPRLFMPVMGALFLLTVPVFRTLPRWPASLRRLTWVFVAASTIWGGFVHYRGATAMAVHAWNVSPGDVDRHPESIWDWRHMQIFEGL